MKGRAVPGLGRNQVGPQQDRKPQAPPAHPDQPRKGPGPPVLPGQDKGAQQTTGQEEQKNEEQRFGQRKPPGQGGVPVGVGPPVGVGVGVVRGGEEDLVLPMGVPALSDLLDPEMELMGHPERLPVLVEDQGGALLVLQVVAQVLQARQVRGPAVASPGGERTLKDPGAGGALPWRTLLGRRAGGGGQEQESPEQDGYAGKGHGRFTGGG